MSTPIATLAPEVASPRRVSLAGALVAMALIAAGCRSPAPAAAVGPRSTDGRLAMGNLEAQIEGHQAKLRRAPGTPDSAAALVELLQTRARVAGRVSDLDQSLAIGEAAVSAHPGDPQALLTRAAGRAAVHRFDDALADAAAAESSGAAPLPLLGLRASILLARGQLAEAVALRRAAAALKPDVTTLGALGGALAASGDAAAARQAFQRAAELYRDTSPFPLAWLDFQRGHLAERQGEFQAARGAYRAVLARLPQDLQAAVHLASVEAALGDRAAAIALLREVVERCEDPEPKGQLASLLEPADPQAALLRGQARAGYDALLARHPQAFADHAARFFLPFDPVRALSLAEQNLALRPTAEAFDLALRAALAAGDTQAGVRLAGQLSTLPEQPRRLQWLADRARAPR